MRHHIDVLGRLHGVWGTFGVLTGLSLAILAAGSWASAAELGSVGRGEQAAVWVLVVSGVILGGGGLAMMAAGRGVSRLRPSGRTAVIVLALPNLVFVPFGTALGVYALWVLLNDDARRAFGRPTRASSSVPTSMEEDV
jgi:choline-glycine betaine transporter